MRRLYTGLALWNLALLAGASALGFLSGRGVDPEVHRLSGLFAAFFAFLVQSIAIVHFIGSMWWIRQTGPAAGMDDTKSLRTAWVKGPMFPALLVTCLLGVACAILGDGASEDPLAWWLHGLLAALLLAGSAVSLVLVRAESVRQLDRMRLVAARADERTRRGEVLVPPREVLLPESSRAGGKVLLWLSLSVWIAWAYVTLVLRRETPLWPWIAGSVVLALVGTALLGAGRTRAASPPPGPPDGPRSTTR